jgi:hypothetical protein
MNTADRPFSKLRTLEYRVLMHFESLRLYWELIILVDRFIIHVKFVKLAVPLLPTRAWFAMGHNFETLCRVIPNRGLFFWLKFNLLTHKSSLASNTVRIVWLLLVSDCNTYYCIYVCLIFLFLLEHVVVCDDESFACCDGAGIFRFRQYCLI